MSIFKAYDIRGTVPDQLNPKLARAIGYAYAQFIAKESGKDAPRLVVGRDMRTHSPEITNSFMRGCIQAGAEVFDLGLTSTPMLYFATAGCWLGDAAPDGGAMVTASHNGPVYNGFKLSRAGAVPISGASGLKDIEALAAKAPEDTDAPGAPISDLPDPDAERWGDASAQDGVNPKLWQAYAYFLKSFQERWPAGKIAADPAHGMGCLYPSLLSDMGAQVSSINDHFDGSFPAHEANPIKPENMRELGELVRSSGAMLGVGFDGDADRVAFCDERGEPLSCDLITALLAKHWLAHDGAAGDAILYDLRSSHALPDTISASGGRPVRDRVGHSFMKATMRRENCAFGGELSGHYYYRDAFFADSAILTVIHLLNLLGSAGEGRTLSQLVSEVQKYAQSGEVNFRVADVPSVLAKIEERFSDAELDHLDGVTITYPEWWFNLRASNTEPLLRLNLEAGTPEEVAQRVDELAAIIGGERE